MTNETYACDLCPRYGRAPRALGVLFVHGYWSCGPCRSAYLIELVMGRRVVHA